MVLIYDLKDVQHSSMTKDNEINICLLLSSALNSEIELSSHGIAGQISKQVTCMFCSICTPSFGVNSTWKKNSKCLSIFGLLHNPISQTRSLTNYTHMNYKTNKDCLKLPVILKAYSCVTSIYIWRDKKHPSNKQKKHRSKEEILSKCATTDEETINQTG